MNGKASNTRKTRAFDERGSVTDVLAGYLAGIGAYELLTADEEVELAQTMEAGIEAHRRLETGDPVSQDERRRLERVIARGEAARQRFVESNLRLVVSNARRYAGRDVEMVDLIQEGNLGLITAVEKFDWRKGFKFSTYATWWIRQAMQRARTNLADVVRLPARMYDTIPAVKAAAEMLQSQLGRAATPEEISEETGIEVPDVEEALGVDTTVALETPIGEDGATLGDFVADMAAVDPDTEVEQLLASEILQESIAELAPLHRRVLELRFGLDEGEPATLARIAEEIGVPQHQLKGVIDESLAALRRALASSEELLVA